MRLLVLPIAVFSAGSALLAAGVLLGVEPASAVGTLLVGGSFLGLIVRSS